MSVWKGDAGIHMYRVGRSSAAAAAAASVDGTSNTGGSVESVLDECVEVGINEKQQQRKSTHSRNGSVDGYDSACDEVRYRQQHQNRTAHQRHSPMIDVINELEEKRKNQTDTDRAIDECIHCRPPLFHSNDVSQGAVCLARKMIGCQEVKVPENNNNNNKEMKYSTGGCESQKSKECNGKFPSACTGQHSLVHMVIACVSVIASMVAIILEATEATSLGEIIIIHHSFTAICCMMLIFSRICGMMRVALILSPSHIVTGSISIAEAAGAIAFGNQPRDVGMVWSAVVSILLVILSCLVDYCSVFGCAFASVSSCGCSGISRCGCFRGDCSRESDVIESGGTNASGDRCRIGESPSGNVVLCLRIAHSCVASVFFMTTLLITRRVAGPLYCIFAVICIPVPVIKNVMWCTKQWKHDKEACGTAYYTNWILQAYVVVCALGQIITGIIIRLATCPYGCNNVPNRNPRGHQSYGNEMETPHDTRNGDAKADAIFWLIRSYMCVAVYAALCATYAIPGAIHIWRWLKTRLSCFYYNNSDGNEDG